MPEHTVTLREATPRDLPRCIEIRGQTRDNAIPAEVLEAIGITPQAWVAPMEAGDYIGVVAEQDGVVVGYCFGDRTSGEVLVLALLPDWEGLGVGTGLLAAIIDKLVASGHSEPWLAASPDPAIRAHGFYRSLGWVPTGALDRHGDEILKYVHHTQGEQE